MVPKGLIELMNQYEIVVVVVLSVDTGEKKFFGDRTALESDYLVRTLFEDLSAQQIQEYLEGQILPRMAQQGKVCGVICKPTQNNVVGLYYHDERDVTQRYKTSKVIGAEVSELWAKYPLIKIPPL